MSTNQRQMHLMLFHSPVGRNTASWRRAGSRVEELYSLEWATYSAQRAEQAKFDAIFFPDKLFYDGAGRNPDLIGYEPLTTIGALCGLTSHIGMIATVSTSFSEPYNVSRMLSQLDFLSKGRVGWNVVTSYNGAQNFNTDLLAKSDRYSQAEDYLQACNSVWDAWDVDAVTCDRENGTWADGSKIRQPNYNGSHYSIQDALSVPRSPQGRPVIAQAGQSPDGMAFAARNAEVVFTAQSQIEQAQDFRRDLNELARAQGRTNIPVLPGLIPIVGNTQQEAESIAEELGDLIQFDIGLASLSDLLLGADLNGLDPDAPIPLERLVPLDEAHKSTLPGASRYGNLYKLAVEDQLTLKELVKTRSKSHGHQMLVGTAASIADEMENWFISGACDGFTFTPPYMPDGLDRICDLLIPELQSRGLFRTEYPEALFRTMLAAESMDTEAISQ